MNTNTAVRSLQRASQQAFRQYHAPFRIPRQWVQAPQRNFHVQTSCSPLIRKRFAPARIANQRRHESTETGDRPLTDRPEAAQQNASENPGNVAARKAQEPAYDLTFTCKKCMKRSTHRITKQAYHFGTTLISCPGCKNRHLISDHLKIFYDKGTTLEDILREKGQYLKKGRLGEDGDIEFYDEDNPIGRLEAEKKE